MKAALIRFTENARGKRPDIWRSQELFVQQEKVPDWTDICFPHFVTESNMEVFVHTPA